MRSLRFRVVLAAALLAGALPAGAAAGRDDTVVISQGVDADTLDPLKTSVRTTFVIVSQMFDTLLVHDTPGHLGPSLASSWRRVAPTVWEFSLRKNVKFWNGDPLTSADVKFTVEKIKDPAYKSQQTPSVNTILRVETPDPYTVRYVSARPTALVPGRPWDVRIVDAKYWQAHGDAYMGDHPLGSGPYVLKSWKKDQEIDLDANPEYWAGPPAIAHVVFRPIPEAASRVAALKTGETDLITNVPAQYTLQLVGGRTTRVTSARSDRVLFIAFNTMKPGPQQNKLVRQAINYAVDVPAIVKNVLGGRAYPIATPIPPGFFGYDPSIPFYGHDPAKAKALLAQAGYPEGKGLELTINSPVGRYNRDKEVAEAVAGQLADVGIKATVKTADWTNYINLSNKRELTPMYLLAWGANGTFDADDTLTGMLSIEGRGSSYDNPEVDKLLAAARYEIDPAQRRALYGRALRIIRDDAPWIFMFQYEDLYATNKRLVWEARNDEMIFCAGMRLRT